MSKHQNEDARTTKSSAQDVRGNRTVTADAERDQTDGTMYTAQERIRMIRDEFKQEALPSVPAIPGFHLCWLSSTASHDPIHKRMRLGYKPVKVEELRGGFDNYRMKTGEFDGCVVCNEMILFKIEDEIYQQIMTEFHHNMPLEEEEALRVQVEQHQQADSTGRELLEVDEGIQQIVQRRRAVTFS